MQDLEVAGQGYTRHWRWVCPTDELDHGRLDTTEEQPPPICWVWNEARGARGYWERFDPEKTVLVSLAEILALRDALAPHLAKVDPPLAGTIEPR